MEVVDDVKDCHFKVFSSYSSSTAVFCLIRTPGVSFFFRTFKITLLVMVNTCAMALIDFLTFLASKWLALLQ